MDEVISVVSLGQLIMLGNSLLGFKLSRYREWWNVLKEEGSRLSIADWWRLVLLALKGIKHNREKGVGFSCKMRMCQRCVLYDAAKRKCRPYDGSDLGCGCYMPFKIALGGGCWANEQEIKEECVGWDITQLREDQLS